MALPPPPTGWTRYLVKSTFGAGRDFAVLEPATEKRDYFVDGRIGTRPKAEIRDSADSAVYQVRGPRSVGAAPPTTTVGCATRQ